MSMLLKQITLFLVGSVACVGSYAQDGADAAAPVSSEPSLPAGGVGDSPADGGPQLPVIDAGTPSEAAAAVKPERSSTNRLVEEIIVTAQKREENLQDVPISIQAFSSEALDARGITSTAELPRITPALTVTSTFGYTMTYLRGIGSDAFLFADPSVVQYVDGVYNPFGVGLVSDFGEVERIEVLKGPQGTLFGRNAIGGAISIVTAKPSLDEVRASAQVSYKDFDYVQSRGSVSIPLDETFAFSIGGLFNHGRPYTDGTVAGKPQVDEWTKGARVKTRWAPAEWMELNLSAYRLQQDTPSANFNPNVNPSPLATIALVRPQDPYKGSLNDNTQFTIKSTTYSGELKLFTDWLDVRLLGSDQNVENRQVLDFDGSPMPLVSFEAYPGQAEVQTAELQLLSNDQSWGSDWLQYIFGVYYFKSDSGLKRASFTAAGTDIQNGTILGFALPTDIVNLIRAAAGGLPIPVGGVIEITGLQSTRSLAYFTQATAKITDWFSLTLGARYQHEKRSVIESSSGLLLSNGGRIEYLNKSASRDPDLADVTNSLDPKISFDFRPGWGWLGEEALLYVSAQTATKSSVYNVTNFLDVTVEKVKPEEMRAYEAGIKTRLFDNLVTLNAAAWRYDIDNLQVQFASLLAGGTVLFENAGSLRSQGVDFDTLVQPFPGVGGPVLTMSGAYVDCYYTSYPNGSGFNPANAYIYSGNNDYTGNRGVRAPKYSGTATLVQTLQTPIGEVELGADYYHSSKQYYLAQNGPRYAQKAYGVVGARVSLLVEPWNLRLTAFGTNLTDTEYTNGLFANDFGVNNVVAPGAVYGVRVNYDFH